MNKQQTKQPKLRFAALRRVSTEQQEEVGESLRTQTTQLEKCVDELGGTIVWYGGQEHATPGHEKQEVQRLLQDAQKKRFDAVVVTDHDRWSRDNASSQAGLEVFRDAGIRFFTGGTEWDLFNPSHVLFLGLNAEIGKFFARNQMKKSLENRIERARRGVPTVGKLPYGRNFIRSEDRQGGHWEVDKEKQSIIADCAQRYLAGAGIDDLAKEYQMSGSNLHKVLTKVSGPKWRLEFTSKVLNIQETIVLDVPPLLDAATIKAIQARAKSNRTFRHGHIKHHYLFSRMISCSHCGYALIGQTNENGLKYYRHFNAERCRDCPGPERKCWVPAATIEDAVMRHLFEAFGNPVAVQRAISEATPNSARIQEAMRLRERVTEDLTKLERSRQRVLSLVVQGTVEQGSATTQLEKLKDRELKLTQERTRLDDELAHIPSKAAIAGVASKVSGQFLKYASSKLWAKQVQANTDFAGMPYAERRQLCQMVFSGKTADGRRMGIAINWKDGGKKWRYEIHGHLIEGAGPLGKGCFVFGAASDQKELVSKSALRSISINSHYRFKLTGA